MKGLDLFSGAGGCSVGYARAGFDMTGVDNRPQPRYPFRFVQADALEYVAEHGHEYDFIAASPPCQAYSIATRQFRDRGATYPNLIAATRERLIATGLPYVIENVPGAPLREWIQICGSGLGMSRIRRHRWFESNVALWGVPCAHGQNVDLLSVVGHSEGSGKTGFGYLKTDKNAAMGIDWMTRDELAQAIPPAYTEWIGAQLLTHLRAVA